MRILIVEDDTMLSQTIQAVLEKEGFSVDAVADGASGVDYILLNVYDLVILDVMLPVQDGYQVARTVRAKGCGTPILMLTARSAVDDRIDGLNAGADYYLPKPFDVRELLACIHALLRRQGGR